MHPREAKPLAPAFDKAAMKSAWPCRDRTTDRRLTWTQVQREHQKQTVHGRIPPASAVLRRRGPRRSRCGRLLPSAHPLIQLAARHSRCEGREASRGENSSTVFQTPAAIPAKPAAPSAVVSPCPDARQNAEDVRLKRIGQSFIVAPPSTQTREIGSARVVHLARTSAVPYAIASSAARARCAVVPRVRPTMVPRASDSQWGASP